MRLTRHLNIVLGLALAAAAPGMASAHDIAVYAYPAENFCPAGLQPVTISGTICCGTPTRAGTYADMMRHPAPRKASHAVRRVYHEQIPTAKGIPRGKGLGD